MSRLYRPFCRRSCKTNFVKIHNISRWENGGGNKPSRKAFKKLCGGVEEEIVLNAGNLVMVEFRWEYNIHTLFILHTSLCGAGFSHPPINVRNEVASEAEHNNSWPNIFIVLIYISLNWWLSWPIFHHMQNRSASKVKGGRILAW